MDHPVLSFQYRTYRLDPKSQNFAFLAGKYASLSLQAIITNPEAFGVGWDTEGTLGPSDYQKRLSRPEANVFICVAHPQNLAAEDQDIEHGAWVGTVTQIGPTSKEVFWLPESGAPEPWDDRIETKWHQTATWIDPVHRGKGIAKLIIEAAVSHAVESMTGDVEQVRVRAFAAPTNEASKRLYGRLEFPHVGLITMPEAMIANGNDIYPFHGKWWKKIGGDGLEMWPEEILQRRMGISMERVIRKDAVNGVIGT